MKERHLALMVFVDEENKVLLQDRRNMSKYGEDWGYFGGKIEDPDAETAIAREICEELDGFVIHDYDFLGKYLTIGHDPRIDEDVKVIQHVFVQRVTKEEIESMVVLEGAGKERFTIDEALALNMYPLDPQILEDARKYIQKNN